MGTWSINPNIGIENGRVEFPLNSGGTQIDYTITYEDKPGCTITKSVRQSAGDACTVRVKSNIIGGTVTWHLKHSNDKEQDIDGGTIGNDGHSNEFSAYCVKQVDAKVSKDGKEFTQENVECGNKEIEINSAETCTFTVETCYDTNKYSAIVKWYSGPEMTEEQLIETSTEYESCFNGKLCFKLTSQALTEVYAFIEGQLKNRAIGPIPIPLEFDSNNGKKIECNGINQISSINRKTPSLELNLSCESIPNGASLKTGESGIDAKDISLGVMKFNSPYLCDDCTPVPTDSVEVKFKLDIDGQTNKYSFSMYDINVENEDRSKIGDPLHGTINTSEIKGVYCLKDDATPNLDESTHADMIYLRYYQGAENIPITLYYDSVIPGANTMTYIYKGTGAYENVSLSANLTMSYRNVGLILTFDGFQTFDCI